MSVRRAMQIAAQISQFARIWLILAVVFTDSLLFYLTHVPWNYYWLFAIACWSLLNVYWTLAARHFAPVTGSRLHFLVFVTEFLLYCLPLSSIPVLGQQIIPRFTALEMVGAFLCAFGVGLAIWARRILAGSWSPVVALPERHALVQDGPYAIIRHPIYFGFIVSAVGMILVLGEIRALVLVFDIGVFLNRMESEEKILRAAYPNEYPDYERRVKRCFPYLW
jgi:protein-S-isoprenylcysteine O-methyltransferase Ste14